MGLPLAAASAGGDDTLTGWSVPPAVLGPILLASCLYFSGWTTLRRRMPERFGVRRVLAFSTGLAVLVGALASPLDALGHHLLLAHMIQHLLLMAVAPPLLWAGAPVAPMLLGL